MKKIFLFPFFFLMCSSLTAQSWQPLGSGFTNNGVFDFIVFNNNLYTSGTFYSTSSSLDDIAQWDGINWNPLGPGMLGGVYSMAVYNNQLFAGGGFSNITGVINAHSIASWDGTTWHSLASGIQWGTVNAMAVYQGNLYVGGNIVTVDGMPMRDIAMWNGTSWSLPCTINAGLSEIDAMAVYNNELYIGGYFGSINSNPTYNIAKFDGSSWTAVGGGLNGDVFALYTDTINNRLCAVGNFNTATGGTVSCPSNVAYWDGLNWNAIGINGPDLHPRAITVYKNEVYTGLNGPSVKVNGDTLHYIARWDGNDWQNLEEGTNGSVLALCVFNNQLAVGGGFTQAGDTAANEVTAWDYTPVGVNEIKSVSDQIKIIPNPINNTASVQLPMSYHNNFPCTFKLYDTTGKEAAQVKGINTLTFSIHKNNLLKGLYVYKLFNKEKEIWTGKVVVE